MSNSQTSNNPSQPAVLSTGHDLLKCHGFIPPPLDGLDDAQLRGHLWELVYALAAKRIFLSDTDHLSDRELYGWLQEDWLRQGFSDLDQEAGCWRQISPAGSGNDSPLGSHRPARDRYLPGPPVSMVGEDTAEIESPAAADDDPLGLAEVDREIRIEQMKSELGALGHEPFLTDHAPPAIEETFLGQVLDIEKRGWERPLEHLNRQGVVLPPPDELTDPTVGPKLWELLHELACRGFYVLNSNHLSDRELYARLWREDLREPAILPGRTPRGGWFHDFVGSGSTEHTLLWLRYYADEEARDQHARDWPDEPLPPREAPPFNRDWRLPKGPF